MKPPNNHKKEKRLLFQRTCSNRFLPSSLLNKQTNNKKKNGGRTIVLDLLVRKVPGEAHWGSADEYGLSLPQLCSAVGTYTAN